MFNPIQGVKTTIKTKKVEAIQLTANTKVEADITEYMTSSNIALAFLVSEIIRVSVKQGLASYRRIKVGKFLKKEYEYIINTNARKIATQFLPELKNLLKVVPESILSSDSVNIDTINKAILTKVYKIIMSDAKEIALGAYRLHNEWKVTEIAFPSLKKHSDKLNLNLINKLRDIDYEINSQIGEEIFDRITDLFYKTYRMTASVNPLDYVAASDVVTLSLVAKLVQILIKDGLEKHKRNRIYKKLEDEFLTIINRESYNVAVKGLDQIKLLLETSNIPKDIINSNEITVEQLQGVIIYIINRIVKEHKWDVVDGNLVWEHFRKYSPVELLIPVVKDIRTNKISIPGFRPYVFDSKVHMLDTKINELMMDEVLMKMSSKFKEASIQKSTKVEASFSEIILSLLATFAYYLIKAGINATRAKYFIKKLKPYFEELVNTDLKKIAQFATIESNKILDQLATSAPVVDGVITFDELKLDKKAVQERLIQYINNVFKKYRVKLNSNKFKLEDAYKLNPTWDLSKTFYNIAGFNMEWSAPENEDDIDVWYDKAEAKYRPVIKRFRKKLHKFERLLNERLYKEIIVPIQQKLANPEVEMKAYSTQDYNVSKPAPYKPMPYMMKPKSIEILSIIKDHINHKLHGNRYNFSKEFVDSLYGVLSLTVDNFIKRVDQISLQSTEAQQKEKRLLTIRAMDTYNRNLKHIKYESDIDFKYGDDLVIALYSDVKTILREQYDNLIGTNLHAELDELVDDLFVANPLVAMELQEIQDSLK